MNRIVMGSSVSAVVLVAVVWFWPGSQSAHLQRELQDAQTHAVRLGQQINELRTENTRAEAQLAAERARVEATTADLRREKEMNARLHLLVSEGRK
jgi:predicted  nucleic acid-binding Zn-ribbon protein